MRVVFLLITLVVFSFSKGLKDENILFGMPHDFKVGYKAYNPKSSLSFAEFVPKTESVKDWSQMLTVSIYHKNLPISANEYIANMKEMWQKECKQSYTKVISEGKENGYDYALIMLYCPKSKISHKEEYTWIKAIKGNDSFYAIQKAFAMKPDEAQITGTMRYLRQVQLCDTRLKNCPKGILGVK
ncbi:hypothetical protein [Sulfurimonas sp. HSL-1716]|uniref:hypothetical protein n=1 Tax=Hydrocurvibacter sulfurireducens TaxID=3131937 RepID=UPI0031F9AB3D